MSVPNEGVKIKNNVHMGYKNHTKSDTVIMPLSYSDGIYCITPGTAVIETYDTGGDDLSVPLIAGDVWYVNIKFLKAATTGTYQGIRLNT